MQNEPGQSVRGLTKNDVTREINGQTLLLDFLAFCFVHRAKALLNSTPQLLARDRRAVGMARRAVQGLRFKVQNRKRSSLHCAQLGPGALRMDAAA
jgi:hypothetical protein